jgi:dienelactone hydrolase
LFNPETGRLDATGAFVDHAVGAGHGFFFYYHTPMYRPGAAMDGWAKVFTFFSRHLSS